MMNSKAVPVPAPTPITRSINLVWPAWVECHFGHAFQDDDEETESSPEKKACKKPVSSKSNKDKKAKDKAGDKKKDKEKDKEKSKPGISTLRFKTLQ